MQNRTLKIGYLNQRNQRDYGQTTASVLHIRAVMEALAERGHSVRNIAVKNRTHIWSADLEHWHSAESGINQTRRWKLFESGTRKLQSLLNLPYANLFDSHRYAQAVAYAAQGFDILYERSWIQNLGGIMAAKRLNIPIVLEFNGDVEQEYEMLGMQLRKSQQFIHRQIRRRLAQADHFVAVSEPLRDRMIDRWQLDPKRITAVQNGAKVHEFSQPKQPMLLKEMHNVSGDDVVIFVSSLKPWHACDVLIDAFVKVAAIKKTATLIMVGDGPERKNLEQQVMALGLAKQVVFTGLVNHDTVPSLVAGARIALINPKVTETSMAQSPLKLFEYMAAGKAIIAPAAPNIVPILAHGKTGWLVDMADSAESTQLAETITHLLDHPQLCAAMGQAAQQQALAQHSWDAVAERLEQIFYDLIDQNAQQQSLRARLPLQPLAS